MTRTTLERSTSTSSGSGGGGFRKFLIGVVAVAVIAGVGYAAFTGKIPGQQPEPSPTTISNPPVLIGEDPQLQFLAASDGEGRVRTCVATSVVNDRRCCPVNDTACDDVKIVVIDAVRMPFIARNIKLAWMEGRPSILHKETTDTTRRDIVCGSTFVRRYPGIGSCDEYPFASSLEGGDFGGLLARTEEVHGSEQDCQGGTIRGAYRRYNIAEGDEYIVLISHPEKIPADPWAGQPYIVTGSCEI